MPYVNIKITDEAVSKEEKQALISGVTKLLQEVLNKDPQTTFVVIDEVNMDNWGIAGQQVSELRKIQLDWFYFDSLAKLVMIFWLAQFCIYCLYTYFFPLDNQLQCGQNIALA